MIEIVVNDKASSKLDKIGKSADNADKEISDLLSSLKDLSSRLDSVEKSSERVTGSTKSLSSATASITSGILRSVAGWYSLTEAIKFVGSSYTDLENKTLDIAKTTGLAKDKLEELTQKYKDLSTSVAGYDLRGLYDIGAIAGQLGIKGTENIYTFTKAVAQMSATSTYSAEEAGTAFATLANQLGEPIKNIEKLTSAVTTLASNTTATEKDVVYFAGRLTAMGKTFGLTSGEILGLAATLKDLGINAELGGTAVSDLLVKLQTKTKEITQRMGLDFEEFSKMIKDEPIRALEVFLAKLGELNKEDKLKVLEDIKMNGSGSLQTLLKLSDGFEKLEQNIQIANQGYADGTATQKEFEIQSQSLTNKINKMMNSLTILAETIGSILAPVVGAIVDAIAGWANGMVKLIGWMKETITTSSTLQAVWNTLLKVLNSAPIQRTLEFTRNAINKIKGWISEVMGLGNSAAQAATGFQKLNDATAKVVGASSPMKTLKKDTDEVTKSTNKATDAAAKFKRELEARLAEIKKQTSSISVEPVISDKSVKNAGTVARHTRTIKRNVENTAWKNSKYWKDDLKRQEFISKAQEDRLKRTERIRDAEAEIYKAIGDEKKAFDINLKKRIDGYKKIGVNEELIGKYRDKMVDEFEKKHLKANKTIGDNLKDIYTKVTGGFSSMLQNLGGNIAKNGVTVGVTQTIEGYAQNLKSMAYSSGNAFAMAGAFAIDVLNGTMQEQNTLIYDLGKDNKSIENVLSKMKDIDVKNMKYSAEIKDNTRVMALNFNQATKLLTNTDRYTANDVLPQMSGLGGFFSSSNILGGFFGDLAAGIGNAIYSKKKEVVNAGLSFGKQTISAFIQGADISAYQQIKTSKSYLGLLKTTKYNMNYSDVDTALKEYFQNIVKASSDSMISALTTVGIKNTEEIIYNSAIGLGNVELKGKTTEEIQKTLEGMLGYQLDAVAEGVINGIANSKVWFNGVLDTEKYIDWMRAENIQKYIDASKGYYEGLIEVATGYEKAGTMLKEAGIRVADFGKVVYDSGNVVDDTVKTSLLNYTDYYINLKGINSILKDLSISGDELIKTYNALYDTQRLLQQVTDSRVQIDKAYLDAAGGVEAFSSSLAYYRDNILDDNERLKAKAKELQVLFNQAGVYGLSWKNVKTMQEYKKMVESIDHSTEAGRKQYAKLLKLAPALKDYWDDWERVNEAVDDGTDGLTSTLTAFIDNLNSLTDRIQSDIDRLKGTQTTVDKSGLIDTMIEFNRLNDEFKAEASKGALADYDKLNSIYGGISSTTQTLGSSYADYTGIINGVIDELEIDKTMIRDTVQKVEIVGNIADTEYNSTMLQISTVNAEEARKARKLLTDLLNALGGEQLTT